MAGHGVKADSLAPVEEAVAVQGEADTVLPRGGRTVVVGVQPPGDKGFGLHGQHHVGGAGFVAGLQVQRFSATRKLVDEQYLALELDQQQGFALLQFVQIGKYHVRSNVAFALQACLAQDAFADADFYRPVADFLRGQGGLGEKIAGLFVAGLDSLNCFDELAEVQGFVGVVFKGFSQYLDRKGTVAGEIKLVDLHPAVVAAFWNYRFGGFGGVNGGQVDGGGCCARRTDFLQDETGIGLGGSLGEGCETREGHRAGKKLSRPCRPAGLVHSNFHAVPPQE